VNVAADGDGTLHRLNVPLLDENRPGLIAKRLDLRLRQRLALHEVLDLPVQIRVRRHRFGRSDPRSEVPYRSVVFGSDYSDRVAGDDDRRIVAKGRVPMWSEEGKTNRFRSDEVWLCFLALFSIISFGSALRVCFCLFLFFFVSLRFLFSILCVQNRKTINNQRRPKKENYKKQKNNNFLLC